jgi:hypothetical protein
LYKFYIYLYQKNVRFSNIIMSCIIGIIPGSAKLKLQLELNIMWGCLSFYVTFENTPLNFAIYETLPLMHHIAHCILVLIRAISFLVYAIWFFSSRHRRWAVREGVPLHHPWRSRSCFLFRSNRRAHLLHLFYSFTLVVLLLSICCVLLCHVSFPPVTHMSRVFPPYPLTFVDVWALRVVAQV